MKRGWHIAGFDKAYWLFFTCRVWRFICVVRWPRKAAPNHFGRFGGGWNYILGAQVGRKTFLLNLLVLSIRIDFAKPNPPEVYR